MRVISGEARGRKFKSPEVESVRPTSDRVREAMFDVLAHLGGPVGARVLDLFAGSGALGIESLSRGAEHVVFVDEDLKVTRTIKENLTAVRLDGAGRTRIVTADAIAYCRQRPTRDRDGADVVASNYDITFLDPPYSYAYWAKLLAVVPGNLFVIESSRSVELPAHLELYRVYRYGSTLVTVAHRSNVTTEHTFVALSDEEPK